MAAALFMEFVFSIAIVVVAVLAVLLVVIGIVVLVGGNALVDGSMS